ncbi:hypothetical protein F4779DRAFT_641617 [Xylariaceae sp. FL0662B]|nr:hypothetical protein F4779DRAFT_641617 [Xylariaceae sp. FL0662B]
MDRQTAVQDTVSLTSDEYAPSQIDEYARENGLSVDSSAELLEKVIPFATRDDPGFKSICYFNPTDFAKLKLEPPLLGSDPDYDCRKLARTIQARREARVDIYTRGIPPERLDASNDESLDFPESAYQYRQEIDATARVEKIDIPKGTSLRKLTLTPPLSPIIVEDDEFVPDEQACQVPILSDPSTLLEADIDAAEAGVLGQDSSQDDSLPQHTDILSVSPLVEAPLLSPKLPGIDVVRVEGPLTPLDSLSPFKGVDMDSVLTMEQMDLSSANSNKDPNMGASDELLTMMEENATSVMRCIEQENLQAADALARVDIPIMDFAISEPEWVRAPLHAASQFSWLWKTYNMSNLSPWPRNSEAERRELCWCPVPSSAAQISITESVEDDENPKAYIELPNSINVPTSADYVWKQPGLAILREIEVEEIDSEPVPVQPEDKSLESLLRKRRLEINNTDLDPTRSLSRSPSPVDLVQLPESTPAVSNQVPHNESNQIPSLLVGCNEPSATSTLLSNYIEFRTSKRQKNTRSSFFPVSTDCLAQADAMRVAKRNENSNREKASLALETKPEQIPASLAPCPPLNPPFAPIKIIKALALPRAIFSRLEKLYANAEIIERDFDRWNTSTQDRNSVSRSPAASPLAAEADVIVSPATGIVVTTLLKAIQKPLPGHKGQAAIRERIHAVSQRYERLIVLVSEGNGVDERVRDLTASDCAGYADFAGFVRGLDADAQAYYVGGGADTLARWTASFLQRHAPEAAEFRDLLIQDETPWELFLRRAGLNAYAAQAILGHLKVPDGVSGDERYRFGLSAFVRMTPVERVQNFRGLMGGQKVLNRVSWMLETRWG